MGCYSLCCGEDSLNPEQEECLVHILNGGDFVALLPTGFWKSLIYQPLQIVSEKLGRPKSGKAIIVIVSPLIALMANTCYLCRSRLCLQSKVFGFTRLPF